MRLLLVEDDRMLGAGLQAGLRQKGWAVDWAKDGEEAEEALRGEPYDVALLDLGLPRKGGLAVLADLRRRGNAIPVLILTAPAAVPARGAGRAAGADDPHPPPFARAAGAARARALHRRRGGRADPRLEVGSLSMDPAAREVTLEGVPVSLSAREFALLQALLERPGRPLSRAQLEERLYGWGEEVESNAVEVHVHALRKKLGAHWIKTLRGVGYMVPGGRAP